MTIVAENRAAQSPQKVLSRTQQTAISALQDYKHQKRIRNGWQLGPLFVSTSVVERLAKHNLVVERRATFGPTLSLTTAGAIAVERLAEYRREKRT